MGNCRLGFIKKLSDDGDYKRCHPLTHNIACAAIFLKTKHTIHDHKDHNIITLCTHY